MTPDEELKVQAPADEVEAVWRLATALSVCGTPAQVAEALVSEAALAAGGTFANMAVLETDHAGVKVAYHPGPGPPVAMTWRSFDLEEATPACDAIRTGLPVLLGSLDEVARRYPLILAELGTAGLSARASIPLHSARGTVVGAIGFGWAEPQAFDAAQLRRLELIVLLAGLALDRATAHVQASEPWLVGQVRRDLETMPSAFFSLDRDLRITYVNAEGEKALRASRHDLVGNELLDVFPAARGTAFEVQYRRAVETGLPVDFEEYYELFDSWYEVHAWPDDDGINVSFWNIDERRQGELKSSAALKATQLANANLEFLTELSSHLRGGTTQTEVLERLTQAVIPTMADWCTLVVPRGEELVRIAAAHRDLELDSLAKRLVGAYPHPFSGPSPGVPVYRSGEPMRLPRLAQHIVAGLDDSAASTAYGRTLVLLGDGPGLIMPVRSHSEVVAVLTMVRSDGEPYTDADVALMYDAVASAATALDTASHIETQRATAGALQDAALPKSLPRSDEMELAASYRAASEGSQVGGDWYDAFELPNGHIALAVGDAAGHGLQATALMAQMRNALRAYLFALLGPAEALASLRRQLVLQEPDAFATAICAEIDPATGDAVWAAAGHPAPVRVNAQGRSAYMRGEPSPPIGWTDGIAIVTGPEHRFTLAPGERLLIFTDGLVERRGVNLDIGVTHLMILAEQTSQLDAQGACHAIFQDMPFASHEDDVCLLIADFKGGGPRSTN